MWTTVACEAELEKNRKEGQVSVIALFRCFTDKATIGYLAVGIKTTAKVWLHSMIKGVFELSNWFANAMLLKNL